MGELILVSVIMLVMLIIVGTALLYLLACLYDMFLVIKREREELKAMVRERKREERRKELMIKAIRRNFEMIKEEKK